MIALAHNEKAVLRFPTVIDEHDAVGVGRLTGAEEPFRWADPKRARWSKHDAREKEADSLDRARTEHDPKAPPAGSTETAREELTPSELDEPG